jgi:DNA invertase Pin-like site-specific DNA recombinase
MNRVICYFRVSTDGQAESGLGLEAQREAVRRYIGDAAVIAAEYSEAASGKRHDRPELRRALDHARRAGLPFVAAKLDRVGRSAALLQWIAESGVEVHFADMPAVSGATGRFLLQSMASVAELEAGLISERTRAALAAAKARGVELGAPDGGAALAAWVRANGNGAGLEGKRKAADARAESWREPLATAMAEGKSYAQTARELDAAGYSTPKGGRWAPMTVRRMVKRLGIEAPAGELAKAA